MPRDHLLLDIIMLCKTRMDNPRFILKRTRCGEKIASQDLTVTVSNQDGNALTWVVRNRTGPEQRRRAGRMYQRVDTGMLSLGTVKVIHNVAGTECNPGIGSGCFIEVRRKLHNSRTPSKLNVTMNWRKPTPAVQTVTLSKPFVKHVCRKTEIARTAGNLTFAFTGVQEDLSMHSSVGCAAYASPRPTDGTTREAPASMRFWILLANSGGLGLLLKSGIERVLAVPGISETIEKWHATL